MRFSLISLLAFTALIAIVCGVFFALPDMISLVVLITITMSVVPAASISGIVFGCGKTRAFWIGVLASIGWVAPVMVIFTVLGGMGGVLADDGSAWVWKAVFAVVYATGAACGGVAIGVRWLCLRGASATSAANSQLSPTMVVIDPRDKAELYAILHGRMTSRVDAQTNGSQLPPAASEYDAAQR